MDAIGRQDELRREEQARGEATARTVECPCCHAAIDASCVTMPAQVAGRAAPGGKPRSYHTIRVSRAHQAARGVTFPAAKVTP